MRWEDITVYTLILMLPPYRPAAWISRPDG